MDLTANIIASTSVPLPTDMLLRDIFLPPLLCLNILEVPVEPGSILVVSIYHGHSNPLLALQIKMSAVIM